MISNGGERKLLLFQPLRLWYSELVNRQVSPLWTIATSKHGTHVSADSAIFEFWLQPNCHVLLCFLQLSAIIRTSTQKFSVEVNKLREDLIATTVQHRLYLCSAVLNPATVRPIYVVTAQNFMLDLCYLLMFCLWKIAW